MGCGSKDSTGTLEKPIFLQQSFGELEMVFIWLWRVTYKAWTWKPMQLQEKGNVQHPLYRLISDCRSLMRGFTSITLKQVFQEANGCADLLTKSAIGNGLGLSIFTCCPTVWSVLFHEDSEGFNTLDLLILIFMQPYSIKKKNPVHAKHSTWVEKKSTDGAMIK